MKIDSATVICVLIVAVVKINIVVLLRYIAKAISSTDRAIKIYV